jgi:hypothetical protein
MSISGLEVFLSSLLLHVAKRLISLDELFVHLWLKFSDTVSMR